MHIRPGQPFPLGATWDGVGVNFAVFSEHATGVELCLFDPSGETETHRIALRARTYDVWHVYLEGVGPGQLYGLRVQGPHLPAQSHRFNPHKLLLDPYARAFSGPISGPEPLWEHTEHHGRHHKRSLDTFDTAATMPKCVVLDSRFDWKGDRHPRTPWRDTVVYECHPKGATVLHPEVPELVRGTYLGLSQPAFVAHLKSIGVTAVELLPVQQCMSESHLIARGLTNYWGYNTVGFFAPDLRYAVGAGVAAVTEFKTMVRDLHAAGLEVILDVVYNHTAEGNEHGPTLSFRGLDNASYYHLDPQDRSRNRDYTGCGNSLNLHHPRVLQLVLDSLRYWVGELHVDGFRFDLAPELCREPNEFHRHARLFTVAAQDPVLAGAKLIAEPWDLGPGGYQVGAFPQGWCEWNDKFRDTVRRFWRGDSGQAPELASRLTGSSDVFSGRSPQASMNFVTAHDGFTLRDLVSYDRKHNEANGEKNQDGFDHNFSHNWGVEGPATDADIRALRLTVMRSMLGTLLLSQGVPMISGGDEVGRTQGGNNNAYCQDNATSWTAWQLDEGPALLAFVRELGALRQRLRVLHRESFFSGKPPRPTGVRDLVWLAPNGRELTASDWSDSALRTFGMLVDGTALDGSEAAEPQVADTVLVWLNATPEMVSCTLPKRAGAGWTEALSSAGEARGGIPGSAVEVAAFGLVVLVQTEG